MDGSLLPHWGHSDRATGDGSIRYPLKPDPLGGLAGGYRSIGASLENTGFRLRIPDTAQPSPEPLTLMKTLSVEVSQALLSFYRGVEVRKQRSQ